MGLFDNIPIVSQLESLGRVIAGDAKGALECQQNLLAVTPVISQLGSAGYALAGDNETALKLQQQFASSLEDKVASTPIVGYVGDGISHLCGDQERAAKYLTDCNKATVVAAAGVATVATGGVAGTVIAAGTGIAAGIGIDLANNEIRYQVTGERKDQGFVEGVKQIHTNRLEGKPILEDCFAQSLGLVGDGMVGVGGRGLGKKAAVEHKKSVAVDKSIKDYTQKYGQEPSCSRSVVKDNLNDAVKSAKENKALIQTEKKKGTGPVQCNMRGDRGINGNGVSQKSRLKTTAEIKKKINEDFVKAKKEHKEAISKLAKMEEDNAKFRSAGNTEPHSSADINRQRDVSNGLAQRKAQLLREKEAITAVEKTHKSGYQELQDNQLPPQGRHRNSLACAENQAAELIYRAGQTPATSSAVRINEKGRVYGAERCGTSDARTNTGTRGPGCNQYDLGPCPTDYLERVKLNPGGKKRYITVLVYWDPEGEQHNLAQGPRLN